MKTEILLTTKDKSNNRTFFKFQNKPSTIFLTVKQETLGDQNFFLKHLRESYCQSYCV